MKIEDSSPNKVIFRTSHACPILGAGCLMAGISMGWQACAGNQLLCFFSLIRFCSVGAALILCIVGAAVMSYGRKVVIDGGQKQLLIEEHSLLKHYSIYYNFEDIEQIEICPLAECLLTAKTCFWTIKGYLKRNGGLEAIYIYSGGNIYDAAAAASIISKFIGCVVVKDIGIIRELSFTGKTGEF